MLEQFKMVYLSGGSGSDAFRFVWTKVLPINSFICRSLYGLLLVERLRGPTINYVALEEGRGD